MRNLVPGARLLAGRVPGAAATEPRFRAATTPELPEYVRYALAQWRLLHDVPFAYLVPDARDLPPESIRFFQLGAAWLDALAAGALAVGATTAVDQARVAEATPALTASAAGLVPLVRDVRRGRVPLGAETLADDPDERPVTGFLLHSALVADWPGLSVRAFTTVAVPQNADADEWEQAHPETVVPLLRLERLAPAVLLVLFDGAPALVWLEEPHHGVQLGVETDGNRAHVPLRGPTGDPLPVPEVAVPMRSGPVPGVVNVEALAAALDTAAPMGAARGSAGLALSLLQPPSRQRFAATSS